MNADITERYVILLRRIGAADYYVGYKFMELCGGAKIYGDKGSAKRALNKILKEGYIGDLYPDAKIIELSLDFSKGKVI